MVDDRQLCCLLVYCFKMNWWDSSVEKLIHKFCFQFHLVRKTGIRKPVPVFWYQFSVPISGACVFGITGLYHQVAFGYLIVLLRTRFRYQKKIDTDSHDTPVENWYRFSGTGFRYRFLVRVSLALHFTQSEEFNCDRCGV